MFPHGGGIEAAARLWQCQPEDILDLSTGLHPLGPPSWLGQWMQAHSALVGQYPDRDGEPARTALAAEFKVSPAQVLVVAGAQAVIEIAALALGWQSMAIATPCYQEPIRCARRAGCKVLPFSMPVEIGAAAAMRIPKADALWWTSPHNPSGIMLPFPQGYTGVLDESYMPFDQRRDLGVLPGIIRLGSLTKSFAIAGLRLGYVVAESERIAQLRTWLSPWPAPTPALHLLPDLLSEADQRDQSIALTRSRLISLLQAHGWPTYPSAASFVLAKSAGLMPDFAGARILVRHFPEWPPFADHVRFGLPATEYDWQRLQAVLSHHHPA